MNACSAVLFELGAMSDLAPRTDVFILFNCLRLDGDQRTSTCLNPDSAETLQVERKLRRQEQDY
jgi:hypothetical protein